MHKMFRKSGLRIMGILSMFLCSSRGGSIVQSNPSDSAYTSYSLAFTVNKTYPIESGNDIRIPLCNHYAVNRGSVIYSPCTASYLVAFDNYGAILPPNLCAGSTCPMAGYQTAPPSCSAMTNSNGYPLALTTTMLFDPYCDYIRAQNRRCVSTDAATAARGQQYYPSPPVFSATTNWCDPLQTSQPETLDTRVALTTGESNYPFTFASATQTMTLGKHTCPGDISSAPGPSTNDVVMQICLPGCSSVVAPITITMNLKDEVKRKKDGWWYWRMGVWDFSNKQWNVICDQSKTIDNLNRHLDILEVIVPASTINQYIDQTSKCLLFAPVTNYKGCPGRPYVGLTPGETAAMAACSMFAFMLAIHICICALCITPRATLLVQPSQQQVVYVEAPQAVPQIVEKVVETVVPGTYGVPQLGYEQGGQYTTTVLPAAQGAGQYSTATLPNYGYPQISGLQF